MYFSPPLPLSNHSLWNGQPACPWFSCFYTISTIKFSYLSEICIVWLLITMLILSSLLLSESAATEFPPWLWTHGAPCFIFFLIYFWLSCSNVSSFCLVNSIVSKRVTVCLFFCPSQVNKHTQKKWATWSLFFMFVKSEIGCLFAQITRKRNERYYGEIYFGK